MINIIEIKELLIQIIKRASSYMMNDFKVYEKSGTNNIVTTSDLNVQNFLFKELSSLIVDSGFICEESNLIDENHDYVWIIDPIDGTENYSRRIAECSISVALKHENEIILGVVYNPYNNELFSAIKGMGSYLNDERIEVSSRPFNKSVICAAMSLYKKEYANICSDIIMDVYLKCKDFRRFGGAALEICYLAMGRIELFFEFRIFIWDYAAAYLILKEAGGILKGFDGEDLIQRKVSVVVGANNLENYNILNNIILNHMNSIPYDE